MFSIRFHFFFILSLFFHENEVMSFQSFFKGSDRASLNKKMTSSPFNFSDRYRISGRKVAVALSSFGLATLLSSRIVSAATITEDDYVHGLEVVIETEKLLNSVKEYITNLQYDQVRTNIKYCLNQLQLQKAITNLIQGF